MNEEFMRKPSWESIARLDRLDGTRDRRRRFSRWRTGVVAAAALSISVGLYGCGDSGGPREVLGDHTEAVTEADVSPEAEGADRSDAEPEAEAAPDTEVGFDAGEDADATPDSEVAPDSTTEVVDAAADEGVLPELCDDSRDNDGDGLCDCLDPDCVDSWDCEPVCPPGAPWFESNCVDCHDGPDCDGLIDCDDPDCHSDPHCAG